MPNKTKLPMPLNDKGKPTPQVAVRDVLVSYIKATKPDEDGKIWMSAKECVRLVSERYDTRQFSYNAIASPFYKEIQGAERRPTPITSGTPASEYCISPPPKSAKKDVAAVHSSIANPRSTFKGQDSSSDNTKRKDALKTLANSFRKNDSDSDYDYSSSDSDSGDDDMATEKPDGVDSESTDEEEEEETEDSVALFAKATGPRSTPSSSSSSSPSSSDKPMTVQSMDIDVNYVGRLLELNKQANDNSKRYAAAAQAAARETKRVADTLEEVLGVLEKTLESSASAGEMMRAEVGGISMALQEMAMAVTSEIAKLSSGGPEKAGKRHGHKKHRRRD